MSTTGAAQLAFAAEFAVFLVSVAGLTCALRPRLLSEVPWARSALAAGFLGQATMSFLHGALIVEDTRRPMLLGARLVATALIALGALRWHGGSRGRVAVAVGVVALFAANVALQVGGGHPALADGCRLVGAAALGAAIVMAGRRSIPARIGVSAAALLLGVVLAVSTAVSYTVSRNVQDEAVRRYAARAANEADAVAAQARGTLVPAKLIAGELSAGLGAQLAALLPEAPPAGRPPARGTLTRALTSLTDDRLLSISDPVLFVGTGGAPEAAVPAALDTITRLALAGDPVVAEARRATAERQGVAVVGGRAYALAAVPTIVRPAGRPQRFSGLVVIARRLDDTYLRVLGTAGEPLSFALVDGTRVLATSGQPPPADELRRIGAQVVDAAQHPRRVIGSRLVAAAPVAAVDQPPVMGFVVSVPTTTVDATRRALFRNLFVVALAAALLALVLAVIVGERIGAGLRRLTAAAERLRAGDFDTPVRVRSGDELGVLGDTFASMAGSIREMTGDLRQAAEDEARVRARLEAVVAGMDEALVAVDAGGTVIEFNRAAERLLGARREDVLGAPVGATVRVIDDDGQRPRPVDPATLPVRRPIEVELAAADETAVPVVLTAGILRDAEGRPDGAVLVLRDVRREREVEDMKTSFLANISHELRTPLTPIKGYAGMLRDRDVGRDRTQAFATEISAGVDQLERVIAQLVTFATIAAGRLDLHPEPVDPARLVAGAVDRWHDMIDGRHRIESRLDGSLPTVLVDGTHLARALDELLDNAVKYSPEGGPVVVRAALDDAPAPDHAPPGANGDSGPTADAPPRPRVVISVSDEGIGIDPEQLEHLTGDFAQGDGSATRRFGGLGLGLAYVERILDAHGGSLRCASLRGGGTTISMLIPVAPAPESDVTAPPDVEVGG
ncbi:MAG: hypothetical protein JWN46_3351 [Acidimicrobiales bacterium]|nr:hypothetical protein [Acidimicrobiales bacterium]